jgi:hypothetical protein
MIQWKGAGEIPDDDYFIAAKKMPFWTLKGYLNYINSLSFFS